MSSPIVKTILIVSGIVAIAIGGSILVAPASFYAGYGITLVGDPNLVNELQGLGGLLLGSGVLIVDGGVRVAAQLYGSGAVERALSRLRGGPGCVAGGPRHAIDRNRTVRRR